MKSFNVEPVKMLEVKQGNATIGVIVYESDIGDTIVKIVTDNHQLGVTAEYAFIEHQFPGYKMEMQSLTQIELNGVVVRCDEMTISNETDEKLIYFDISDFFENAMPKELLEKILNKYPQ